MRKMLAILALSFATLIALPMTAHAGNGITYGTETAAGSVVPGTTTDGGTVTFSGDGFASGATITIAEDGEVEGTVTANSPFSTTVTVNGVGDAVLTATGADEDGEGNRVVSATVRVLAASGGVGGADDGLAATGADGTGTQVWAGIGLLGVGAGLIALTVSRRRAATVIA